MRLFFCVVLFCGHAVVQGQGCVDPELINPDALCTLEYNPVCGCNGVTYDNSCIAINFGGVTSYESGPCEGGPGPVFPDPCGSLPGDQLGDCDAVLGWGRVDGLCTSISGCDVNYLGTDWSSVLFGSPEECAFSCDTPCIQPALIELGTMIDCVEIWEPVCGCDGVTYTNECHATYIGGVVSWTEGPCIVIEYGGCTYPQACNYDPNAAFEDGSCTFPPAGCTWPDGWNAGCTYPAALNFDATALVDDGSCLYPDCSGCLGDLDGDSLVTVGDILTVLGQFGLACE